jgi:hypothetical protein
VRSYGHDCTVLYVLFNVTGCINTDLDAIDFIFFCNLFCILERIFVRCYKVET